MWDGMGCAGMDHSGLKTWLDKRDIHAFLRSIEHALIIQGFAWWNSTTIFIDMTHFQSYIIQMMKNQISNQSSESRWVVHFMCRIRRASEYCCLKHTNHFSIISRICRIIIEKRIDSTKWSVERNARILLRFHNDILNIQPKQICWMVIGTIPL